MNLAAKYRPTTFEDGFIGQAITAAILKKTISEKKFKNIMLFSGASGCGKTTSARIVANLINEGIGDPIELDCASNNGVDQIRAIIEEASTRALVGTYKIFILDECHMITPQGWNAFLKCLEECPKNTVLLFCTTDPSKIPLTVLNRMQRFNFAPIDASEIYTKLVYICNCEGFTNYQATCDFISRTCNGCMREAIQNLERCADFSTDLSIENTKQILNGLSYETMFKLTWAIRDQDAVGVFTIMDELYKNGQDLKNFISIYIEFILNLTKYILFNSITLTTIPNYLATDSNPVVQSTVAFDNNIEFFNYLTDILLNIKTEIKYDTNYKATITAILLKAVRRK